MNTNVRVRTTSATKQLVIPYPAVTEQLGQSAVYVVTDSSTVEERMVELVAKVADKVVGNEGLSLGYSEFTQGLSNLRSGPKVTVQQQDTTKHKADYSKPQITQL